MLPARYSVHSFTLEVEMTSLFAPIWPVSVKLNRAHANDGLGVDLGQCQGQHSAHAVAAGGRL